MNNEALADKLGQITFRLETNLLTMITGSPGEARLEARQAMVDDIERLKDLKAELIGEHRPRSSEDMYPH